VHRARVVQAMRTAFERERLRRGRDADASPRRRRRARADYLVPSRVHPGSSTPLPQSPQIFKQILMVAGSTATSRSRAASATRTCARDRQPEFTQLDMEMAFVEEEDVFASGSACSRRRFRAALGESSSAVPAHALERGDGALRRRQARLALRLELCRRRRLWAEWLRLPGVRRTRSARRPSHEGSAWRGGGGGGEPFRGRKSRHLEAIAKGAGRPSGPRVRWMARPRRDGRRHALA
jgi:hypothetical protein